MSIEDGISKVVWSTIQICAAIVASAFTIAVVRDLFLGRLL